MATHSSTLAWEIPWIEENGGLQSMGLQRAGHDRAHTEKQKKWHGPKSSGESAGSQLQPAGVWQETRPQPDPTAISWREWHVSFVLYKGNYLEIIKGTKSTSCAPETYTVLYVN